MTKMRCYSKYAHGSAIILELYESKLKVGVNLPLGVNFLVLGGK